MAASLPESVLERFPRISRYNSPYPAHDHGCAIDLYPPTNIAPSPVAGEVLDTLTTRAPSKPYAVAHDHLILVDVGEYVARVLHVEPAVEAGDHVAVGDPLGEMVRSGYFAPWVGNHVHLEFRDPDANLRRASGSVPLDLQTTVEPLAWDGTGTVEEVGDTYVVLDRPTHPAPGEYFAGIAPDAGGSPLDGGLPHYDAGGTFHDRRDVVTSNTVSLLGAAVGSTDGRDVTWNDVTVLANGEAITGLSLYAGLAFVGAKLVHPGHDWTVGDEIEVSIQDASGR